MARVSRYFNQQDWQATTSGTGSIAFADGGKSVICDAPAGSAAYLLNYVVAWPSDSFEFTCLARNKETGKAGWAEMFIDSPIGSRKDEARITGETLTAYKMRYDVPIAASSPRVVVFGVGTDTPTDGSAEYALPYLTKVKGDNSWLYGTYKIASAGGCTVHPTLKSFNTDNANISWNAAQLRYDITPTETVTFANGSHRFKPTLTATAEQGNSTSDVINWNISGVQDNGGFYIQAINNATGARIDLSTGVGIDLFINVKMELL